MAVLAGPASLHPVHARRGSALRILAAAAALAAPAGPSAAHDWFSDYTTGPEEFQSCCGDNDCRTAESLGHPEIVRRDDGGYEVRIGRHWVRYDFPAVHTSHDSHIWVCYLSGDTGAPEPLCLFLPPGTT